MAAVALVASSVIGVRWRAQHGRAAKASAATAAAALEAGPAARPGSVYIVPSSQSLYERAMGMMT